MICQSRAAEKHDLALVVEATQGMSSTLNDLYSTFEFLQSRRSALHKVISSYLVATFDLEGKCVDHQLTDYGFFKHDTSTVVSVQIAN